MWKCSVKLLVALVSSKILSFLAKLGKSRLWYHHNLSLWFMCLYVLVRCGKYHLLSVQHNKGFREVLKNWRKFPGLFLSIVTIVPCM